MGFDLGSEQIIEIDDDLEITGGASEDLFPSINRWFLDSVDNRRAFELIMNSRGLTNYKSYADCILCEVFKELKIWCFKFYRGEGPHLSKIISLDDQVRMEGVLLQVLAYAYIVHEASLQAVPLEFTWEEFMNIARNAMFGDRRVV